MVTTKSVLTISSLAFLALFGGGLYMFMHMGDIAKGFIEAKATEALGVKVRMADLDIYLQDKKARVRGLTIANPKGFSEPYVVSVDVIAVSLGDISAELINFKNIRVSGVDTHLEVNESGTNLSALKKGMSSKPKSESAAQDGPKVVINKFALTGAKVTPHVVLYSQEGDVSAVAIPDIRLSGIGRKGKGVTTQEAVVQIMGPFVNAAIKAAAKDGLFKGLSSDVLEGMGVGSLDSGFGESIKKGFGGLFGGD